MLILTISQLQEQGFLPEEVEFYEQIKCGSKLMHRVADFPLTESSKAIETGKNYLGLGSFSFITKSRIALTVWAEKKDIDVNFAKEIDLKIEQAKKRISSQIFQAINRNQVNKKQIDNQEKTRNREVIPQAFKALLPKEDKNLENNTYLLDIYSDQKITDKIEEMITSISDSDNNIKKKYRGVSY